ncbi:MAG: hypothetical protein JO257_06030 [Deltaproteobacteria bacterium]|nr:hypothetical protein [Deltaproteobacteria bacterium]
MTFKPGDPRINRAGRPRGFAGVARMIAEATGDGRELVDWALRVWRDPDNVHTHSERAAAHDWLSSRYLGRPLQQSEILALARVEHVGLPAGWSGLDPTSKRAFLDDLERRRVIDVGQPALAAASTDDDA